MAYRWKDRPTAQGANAMLPAALVTLANYPAEASAESGVTFGSASEYTGTYDPMAAAVFPTSDQVLGSIDYGPTGDDYTGELFLEASNIRDGVAIAGVTGNLTQPSPGKVLSGTAYGAAGNENIGEFEVPAEADVEAGVVFGTVVDERVGTLVVTPGDGSPQIGSKLIGAR